MRSGYETSANLSVINIEELCRKLDFHWFPINQWIFELFGRQIRVSCIELSP